MPVMECSLNGKPGYQVGDRHCLKCGHIGPVDDFVKDPRYRYERANLCQRCANQRRRRRQLVLRKAVATLATGAKAKPCADCGRYYPPYVMDFDHVRGQKLFDISQARAGTRTVEKVMEEMAKCDVVCSNCHRERTHGKKARREDAGS